MSPPASPLRRKLFHRATALALGGVVAPAIASVRPTTTDAIEPRGERRLAFQHLHTGERLTVVYAVDSEYVPESLGALNRLLRDHYSGEVGSIAPPLFDQLHRLQQLVGSTQPFQVISGYRAPTTNARLRETRGGGVARHSLHVEGRAIDVRLPGVELARLRDAAHAMRAGGVGYYPREQFVHLDNGAVRRW
jgi:uncharacterized protein YcbK (DUF882 family)